MKARAKRPARTASHEGASSPAENLSLRNILDAHAKEAPPGALAFCLGDGFLTRHNPVFDNVRNLAQRFGYSYTTEDFCHYGSLKLVGLEQILSLKRIPYCDNVSTLLELERSRPGVFTFNDVDALTKNYLLHETAHCLADWYFKNQTFDFAPLDAERALFLRLNIGEAFANTVENFARNLCDSDLQLLFLDWNTYPLGPPALRRTFADMLEILGPKALFKCMFFGYLFANFRYSELSEKGIKLVLGVIGADANIRVTPLKALHKLVNSAFNLNEKFRVKTQSFYLRMLGVNTDCAALCNFNFLATIARNPELMNLIDEFAKVTERQRGDRAWPLKTG
jgi:hypothetical protein